MRAGRLAALAALAAGLMAAPAQATPARDRDLHDAWRREQHADLPVPEPRAREGDGGEASVLRAARISVSRARVEHRGRWTLLVDLRRSKAKRTATVRLVPRHGRARTLRLPVLGCGRVA